MIDATKLYAFLARVGRKREAEQAMDSNLLWWLNTNIYIFVDVLGDLFRTELTGS